MSEETFARVARRLTNIDLVSANEYFLHEAGHRLGYTIEAKSEDGFFRHSGRIAWPLVYAEEYRADIGSWDVALRELPHNEFLMIITYTLAHRLGLAMENMREGKPGAGMVPYLHFWGLLHCGFLKVL